LLFSPSSFYEGPSSLVGVASLGVLLKDPSVPVRRLNEGSRMQRPSYVESALGLWEPGESVANSAQGNLGSLHRRGAQGLGKEIDYQMRKGFLAMCKYMESGCASSLSLLLFPLAHP
jgi:hypothetical protein